MTALSGVNNTTNIWILLRVAQQYEGWLGYPPWAAASMSFVQSTMRTAWP